MSKNQKIQEMPDKATESFPRYVEIVSGFSRDENGFLKNIDYKFNLDGTINWRAMIKPEYLVPNRESFKDLVAEEIKKLNVQELPDNKLLILLAGIKELAQIRGFSHVSYDVLETRPDYVAVKCSIAFYPNYETNNQPVVFSALADAHWDNTHNFAKNFLMAIAENRAFVRCVRSFLKIHIVGSDEMGGGKNPQNTVESESYSNSAPASLLEKTMQDYNISFQQIKDGAIRKNIDGASSWTGPDDIPPLSVFTIVSGIKNKNKK